MDMTHRRRATCCLTGLIFMWPGHSSWGQLRVVTLPPALSEATTDFSPTGRSADPLLLRPGHYVLPGPPAADYWSPHLRPFPDYSTLRARPGSNFNRSFGATAYPRGYGPCGPVFGYGYNSTDVRSAYNQGRYDADHEYLWHIASARAGRLINQSSVQFDEGLRFFRVGQYEKALVNLLGAGELNHDSAAPRLHAGHTYFALGRYDEAVTQLARAFELLPTLAYKTYDIRDEYGNRDEFAAHLESLEDFVRHHPRDAAALTVLGYVRYYSSGPASAASALRAAAKLDRRSFFIPKLLQVSVSAGSAMKPTDKAHPSKRMKSPPKSSPIQTRLVRAEFKS